MPSLSDLGISHRNRVFY